MLGKIVTETMKQEAKNKLWKYAIIQPLKTIFIFLKHSVLAYDAILTSSFFLFLKNKQINKDRPVVLQEQPEH